MKRRPRPVPRSVVIQERCYLCGDLIPEGQVERVCVQTGSGSMSGTTGGSSFGHVQGDMSINQMVSMCPRCAEEWQRYHSGKLLFWLYFLGVMIIVVVGAAAAFRLVIGGWPWQLMLPR